MSDELLPCPCCNAPGYMVLVGYQFRIKCTETECGMQTPAADSKAQVNAIWSRRAQSGITSPRETAKCDCQNPEPESGAALISNECPIHNLYPNESPEKADFMAKYRQATSTLSYYSPAEEELAWEWYQEGLNA